LGHVYAQFADHLRVAVGDARRRLLLLINLHLELANAPIAILGDARKLGAALRLLLELGLELLDAVVESVDARLSAARSVALGHARCQVANLARLV